MTSMAAISREFRSKDRAEVSSSRILENIPKAHARSDAHTILKWLRCGVLRRRQGSPYDSNNLISYDYSQNASYNKMKDMPQQLRRGSSYRSVRSLSPASAHSSASASDLETRSLSSTSLRECSTDDLSSLSYLERRRCSRVALRPRRSRSSGHHRHSRNVPSRVGQAPVPPRPLIFTCPCCSEQRRLGTTSCPTINGSDIIGDASESASRRVGRRIYQSYPDGSSQPHLDLVCPSRGNRRLLHCSSNPQLCALSPPTSSSATVSRSRRAEGKYASWKISSWSLTADDEPHMCRSRPTSSLHTNRAGDTVHHGHGHHQHHHAHLFQAPRLKPTVSSLVCDERSLEILEDREQAAMKMKRLNGLSCQKSSGTELGDSEVILHLIQLKLLD